MKTIPETAAHLPPLTMAQCMKVFAAAKLGPARIARLCGVSRMMVWKWRKGSVPRSNAMSNVSTLAYKCLRTMRDKRLPVAGRPNDAVLTALLDAKTPKALTNYSADELLPKGWLKPKARGA